MARKKLETATSEGLEIHIPRRRERERRRLPRHEQKKLVPFVHTNVPQDKAFLTIDGRHIYNLVHLAGMLEEMDDHVFRHHANAEKNDFSSWIRDVMGKAPLAERIRDKDRKDTQIELLKHIVKELL